MMHFLTQQMELDGVATSMRLGGNAAAPALVFLHGGIPGTSPYCAGAYLWGTAYDSLAANYHLVMPDLLGCAGTGTGTDPVTLERIGRHVLSLVKAISDKPVHLVGHDLGALIGLWCAMETPDLVASLTLVASSVAAPSGDVVSNLSLLSPPLPLWSRESQAWTFDRLSHSHQHIDHTLLDGADAAAAGPGHQQLVQRMAANPVEAEELAASIMRAKFQFFKTAREGGIKVPVQLICAKDDPQVSVEQSLWLFQILARGQRNTQFQILNRTGSFPFREQGAQFCSLLDAFVSAVRQESAL